MKRYLLLLLCAALVVAPAILHADPVFYVIDSDNNGNQTAAVSGLSSFDPDGQIIDYNWKINNVVVGSGYGPTVQNLSYNFSLGTTTVLLTLRDDSQVSVSTTARVIVLGPTANQPPVANASVASPVMANLSGVAVVAVDASASSDPNADPITRYMWTEGTTTYYDGANAIQSLNVSGIGVHALKLTVYSTDKFPVTQSGSKVFNVTVTPFGVSLAGHNFARTSFLKSFSFDPPYQSFSGITFDPLTQTYFMTDNALDKVFELNPDGTLKRTIDIIGLKRADVTTSADAEGITWMSGEKFALALHDGKEVAVVTISPTTASLERGKAGTVIYDVKSGPGKPKGLTYVGSEDAFYWVTKSAPMSVVKARISTSTNLWETIWTKNVDNLPVGDLADVAVFPRLSQNLFLISESSKTIMEVDMRGGSAVLKSSMSTSAWPIPQAGGMTFGADGSMVVVGKHVAGLPQDDFNVFSVSPSLANQLPIANAGPSLVKVIDSDGGGSEQVTLNASASKDADGVIVSYLWTVDGTVVATGTGPKVPNFAWTYALGSHTVKLRVIDDAQAASEATVAVQVLAQSTNQPPVANANVPLSVSADINGIAQVAVNASASSDPNLDLLYRFTWTEGTTTYYDGEKSIQTLSVKGVGVHALTLTVYSIDSNGITQSGTKTFNVTVNQFSVALAGHNYSRTSFLGSFTFDPPYKSFAGMTFNPLTQTYFMTDNSLDKIFELQANGSLLRTIDIAGLKRSDVTTSADAEGITWMYGQTFSIALHDGKEVAVLNITPATIALSRAQVTIYDVKSGPGKPKGLTYASAEDAFYWVTKSSPMAVMKARINKTTGLWEQIWTKNVDTLPVGDLADVAVFPKLSSSLFLISESSQTIMEVDMSGALPVLKSSMSLASWPIPQAGGMAFGADGTLIVIGKHVAGLPQDDFNVFSVSPALTNKAPVATITLNP